MRALALYVRFDYRADAMGDDVELRGFYLDDPLRHGGPVTPLMGEQGGSFRVPRASYWGEGATVPHVDPHTGF